VFDIEVDEPDKLVDFFDWLHLDRKHWLHRNPGR
jgi:hypothetical protein